MKNLKSPFKAQPIKDYDEYCKYDYQFGHDIDYCKQSYHELKILIILGVLKKVKDVMKTIWGRNDDIPKWEDWGMQILTNFKWSSINYFDKTNLSKEWRL